MSPLLLQLADSAFPTGGFAHSAGLEATWQSGEIGGADGLRGFARQILWQAGYGALPLVSAAHDRPERLPDFDARCDAFLSSHVSNRASRAQGRAFLTACEQSFAIPEIKLLRDAVRRQRICQHCAPIFGAALKMLDVARSEAQRLFLFLALRGTLSAAVRLGIVGPHQAQRIQFDSAADLEAITERCKNLGHDDLAQTAPLIDLFQSTHDRLYSRLFQS